MIDLGKVSIAEIFERNKTDLSAVFEITDGEDIPELPTDDITAVASGSMIINPDFQVWQRGDMGTHYIKREEIRVDVERLNKKHKGKYRFKARASAPAHYENDPKGKYEEWRFNSSNEIKGDEVYSKTEHGARVTALNSLFQRCRPPLTKKQKLENRSSNGKKYERQVYTEVRVSNSFDFIMNDDDAQKNWHEIRKPKRQSNT